MSKEKIKGFMLFVDQRAAIECLPDSLAGKLLKACYAYADDGSLPTFEEPLLMPVFLMTKTQIDNSKLAYEKRCSVNKANAQKRYASKKDSSITTASDGMQSHSAESDGTRSDAMAAKNNPNNKDNTKSKDNHNDMSNDYIIDGESNLSFDKAWEIYGKTVGNKKTLREMWNTLTEADKASAMEYIPLYVASRPEVKYRKNFENFLNQRVWETEPIMSNTNTVTHETDKVNKSDCCWQPATEDEQYAKLDAIADSMYPVARMQSP